MNVKDLYKSIGGDYEEVFSQLGDDKDIIDFLKKFIERNDMENLKNLLAKKKYKESFICVHNMKGFGLNMALPALHKAASELCEPLRNGKPSVGLEPIVSRLENVYNKIKEGVLKL